MRVETPETALFFAWQGDNGKIDRQKGYKNEKAIFWYGKAKDNRLKADYISVGKFKKGGAGKYRTLENLHSIDKCYSDIDSKNPLEWQELIAKCNRHGIPKPNLIVRTPTPNHYQCVWNIPAIPATDKSLLDLWTLVQEGICNLFKEFGADGQALDAIRYLRNPNKCETAYYNQLCTTSLTVMYRSLKMAGYIQKEFKEAKNKERVYFNPEWTPMPESRTRLCKFLKDNPEYESTFADLSNTLSIPLRTLKLICKRLKGEGKLETKLKGKAKTRKTVFKTKFLKVHNKEVVNTLHSQGVGVQGNGGASSPCSSLGKQKRESGFCFLRAFELAKSGGLAVGVRNFGIFGLALWLKASKKLTCEEVFKELYPVLILTPGFSRREFLKCIRSACRDRYRYCISKEKFTPVFISLGLGGVH